MIGFEDYFAVWDKDGDLDNTDLLDEAKQNGKGLEIDPNLESILRLPAGDNAEKVKNAYEWATNTTNQIPTDFGIVENFLKQNGSNDTSTETSREDNINPEDIPF